MKGLTGLFCFVAFVLGTAYAVAGTGGASVAIQTAVPMAAPAPCVNCPPVGYSNYGYSGYGYSGYGASGYAAPQVISQRVRIPQTVMVEQDVQRTVMVPQTVTERIQVPQVTFTEQDVPVAVHQIPVPQVFAGAFSTSTCANCTTCTNCTATVGAQGVSLGVGDTEVVVTRNGPIQRLRERRGNRLASGVQE